MSIQINWDDEVETILRLEFGHNWTWDDLYGVANQIKAITDKADYEVAAIINLSGGATIPGGNFFSPTSLQNARQLLTLGEGGTGPIVIVGANQLIKMVYETFKGLDKRAAQADITFADTLEAARAHLSRVHRPRRTS